MAGMADKITPAALALVRLTPYNMHTENKKLPKKASRNSSFLVALDSGCSVLGFDSQRAMATEPMAKRSHANKNTGNTATSGLDKAT